MDLMKVISKLTSTKNTENLLESALNALTTPEKQKNPPDKKSPNKQVKYSNQAILSLLKRHDEISKQIDKNTKN